MKSVGCEEWYRVEAVENHPEIRDAVVGDDGKTYYWPRCVVAGCENRSCLRLGSSKCYPHTLPGVPIVHEVEEDEPVTG